MSSFVASSSSKAALTSKSVSFGTPILCKTKPTSVRYNQRVCASINLEKMVAPTSLVVAATLAAPQLAMASEINPSIQALLNSVASGALLAALILGAVTLVANFDPVTRD